MVEWLPSKSQLVKETLAVMFGTIIVAWIISQSPTLKAFVRGNQIPGPFNQP